VPRPRVGERPAAGEPLAAGVDHDPDLATTALERVVVVDDPFGDIDPEAADGIDQLDEPLEVDDDDAVEADADQLLDGTGHGPEPGRLATREVLLVPAGVDVQCVEQARESAVGGRRLALGRERDIGHVPGNAEQRRPPAGLVHAQTIMVSVRRLQRRGPASLPMEQQVEPAILGPGGGR
jgi:hypothetical protein